MDDLLALMGGTDDATNEIAGMAETETDMEKLFGTSICSATNPGRSDRLSKNGAAGSSGGNDPRTSSRTRILDDDPVRYMWYRKDGQVPTQL